MTTTPTPSRFTQTAPATAYALTAIAEEPIHDTAPVLLAAAALADRDLYDSGDGYNGHTAADVAGVLPDADPDDVRDALHALWYAGLLTRMTRVVRNGVAEPTRFRIPQAAYDAANGEA